MWDHLQLNERVRTVASSDALAAAADEVQYARGEGPCLEAMRTGQVVDVPDLAVDDRWGDYRTFVLAQGVRAVLSTPLGVNGQFFGALNLYSTRPTPSMAAAAPRPRAGRSRPPAPSASRCGWPSRPAEESRCPRR